MFLRFSEKNSYVLINTLMVNWIKLYQSQRGNWWAGICWKTSVEDKFMRYVVGKEDWKQYMLDEKEAKGLLKAVDRIDKKQKQNAKEEGRHEAQCTDRS